MPQEISEEWLRLEPGDRYTFTFYTDMEKVCSRLGLQDLRVADLRAALSREMALLETLERHGWRFVELSGGGLFFEREATVAEVETIVASMTPELQECLFAGFELYPQCAADASLELESALLSWAEGHLYADVPAQTLAYLRGEAALLPGDQHGADPARKVSLLAQDTVRALANDLGFTETEASIILSSIANGPDAHAIATHGGYPPDTVRRTLLALEALMPSERPNPDDPMSPPEDRTRLLADELKYAVETGRRRPTGPHHKVGRNEPCPCGSGKKYKLCCGRNA